MMQKKRPVLSPGDVCRISRKFKRQFKRNASIVVLRVVHGDGSDRLSMIECSVSLPSRFGRGGFKKPYKHKFRREQLWFTGYNIHSGETNKSRVSRSAPKGTIRHNAVDKSSTWNQTRGPHLCRCSEQDFARFGCRCNGL